MGLNLDLGPCGGKILMTSNDSYSKGESSRAGTGAPVASRFLQCCVFYTLSVLLRTQDYTVPVKAHLSYLLWLEGAIRSEKGWCHQGCFAWCVGYKVEIRQTWRFTEAESSWIVFFYISLSASSVSRIYVK